jgi:hypothetical protein
MPAGLPLGMPGIGEVIDGAMQHAPQPGRHSMKRTWAAVRTMAESYALKHTFEIGDSGGAMRPSLLKCEIQGRAFNVLARLIA